MPLCVPVILDGGASALFCTATWWMRSSWSPVTFISYLSDPLPPIPSPLFSSQKMELTTRSSCGTLVRHIQDRTVPDLACQLLAAAPCASSSRLRRQITSFGLLLGTQLPELITYFSSLCHPLMRSAFRCVRAWAASLVSSSMILALRHSLQ